jgi:hypothetical protein
MILIETQKNETMKYFTSVILLAICTTSQAQLNANADTLAVPDLIFDKDAVLRIIPSKTSSKNDFDFFNGKWALHNRVLKVTAEGSKEWKEFAATQEMHIILRGIGNIDNFIAVRDGQPFEGMTLRLFNPQTKLWSLYWADSNNGILYLPPVVGSFESNVGHFFSQDDVKGKKLITVYRWDARNPDKPIWSQATSDDNGKTWEWNWFMYMSKVK